jgi:hypothetical protein
MEQRPELEVESRYHAVEEPVVVTALALEENQCLPPVLK